MQEIEINIQKLKESVSKNEIYKTNLFRGADVIVMSKIKALKMDLSADDSNLYVITKYPRELSWLIFELKNIFKDHLDYMNKYEFYGRLGEVANESIKINENNLQQILLDMIKEAEKMLQEDNFSMNETISEQEKIDIINKNLRKIIKDIS